MEKIALISYEFAYNYGTCLQAYALWKAINNIGYSSEYVNFDWKFPTQEISLFEKYIQTAKEYLGGVKHRRFKATVEFKLLQSSNKQQFDKFRKLHIHESKYIKSYQLPDIENSYSKFIVGSDQTWNPDCVSEKFFRIFLLSFLKNSQKKYAYAPSIGKSVLDEYTLALFKQYLNDFSRISCRETNGCRILSKVLNQDIYKVLDPTLLLNKAEWEKIEIHHAHSQKYILCYILGEKKSICEFAKSLANRKSLNLIILPASVNIYQEYKQYVPKGIGPSEFLSLIHHCEYVVTDSFHGSIFSINYNKNFYSFLKRNGDETQGDNSRITDMLKTFGLENRFKNDNDTTEETDINYQTINKILQQERDKSINYLLSILKD